MDPITVTYDPTAGTLSIDTSSVQLDPDVLPIHSVVWRFEGTQGLVDAGWAPAIEFRLRSNASDTEGYAGPFTNLCATPEAVIGCGNTGVADLYNYVAVLRPPDASASAIESDPATIDNRVEGGKAPVIVVERDLEKGVESLKLSPDHVTLWPGQSLLWEVTDPGLSFEWSPRIVFLEGPEGAAINPHFGPFTSLDTRGSGLLGTGNIREPGRYTYVFQLIRVSDGSVQLKSTGDPEIDDEGDPATGPDPYRLG